MNARLRTGLVAKELHVWSFLGKMTTGTDGRWSIPPWLPSASTAFGCSATRLRNPVARRWRAKELRAGRLLRRQCAQGRDSPRRSRSGRTSTIHAEGPLSIHPEAVIHDRFGVMHNVTIGTNMGRGRRSSATTSSSGELDHSRSDPDRRPGPDRGQHRRDHECASRISRDLVLRPGYPDLSLRTRSRRRRRD